jgi:hypothetical protein
MYFLQAAPAYIPLYMNGKYDASSKATMFPVSIILGDESINKL